MINGKRIDIIAVSYNEEIFMCTAPYCAALCTGDKVEVEGIEGFATVLITESHTYGGEEFRLLDDMCLLRKILKRVDFKDMDWSGYEEENTEYHQSDGQTHERPGD